MSAPPVLSRPLSLNTIVSIDSNVKVNQDLYEGNSALIYKHGFYRSLLSPRYKSIKVESTSCTNMIIDLLRQINNGIALKLTAKGIFGCPYSPYVRIVSTTKSKDTKVSFNIQGRNVLLNPISTINAYNNIKGQVIIGSSAGSAQLDYLGYSKPLISNLYIRSSDSQEPSPPLLSPKPYLNSVATLQNNLHRVCTDKDNNIISRLDYQPKIINSSNCLDTVVADKFLVQSPKGYAYYRFQT